MIKHFGEGITYPIKFPVLGFSERGRREFPVPTQKGVRKCSEPRIKLITLLIKHFPSLLFWKK